MNKKRSIKVWYFFDVATNHTLTTIFFVELQKQKTLEYAAKKLREGDAVTHMLANQMHVAEALKVQFSPL